MRPPGVKGDKSGLYGLLFISSVGVFIKLGWYICLSFDVTGSPTAAGFPLYQRRV